MASLRPVMASIQRPASTACHVMATARDRVTAGPSAGAGPGRLSRPAGGVSGAGDVGGGGGDRARLVGLGERERRPVQHLGGPGAAEQLDEAGDGAGPPGLVAGPYPRPVVAVEVLVEQQQVAPVRVVLKVAIPP